MSSLAIPCLAQTGKIAFEQTTFTFEDLREGDVGRHVFTFRNEGSAPLHVTNVRTSCGCTVPDWVKGSIAPGGTGTVTVVYNSTGRPGSFYKPAYVETDGDPQMVTLYIEGEVKARWLEEGIPQGNVIVDKDVADFGDVSKGRDIRYTFQMQNTGKRPIRITALNLDADNVHALFPSMPIFTDDVVKITVIVTTDDLPVGSTFDYIIQLSTDDEAQPDKSFRVHGRVAQESL